MTAEKSLKCAMKLQCLHSIGEYWILAESRMPLIELVLGGVRNVAISIGFHEFNKTESAVF